METEASIGITRRKTTQYGKLCVKEERNASLKKVSSILQKAEHERSVEEQQMLIEYTEVVADLKQRWQRRVEAKRRLEEIEEPIDVLVEKCKILAEAIAQSEHLVIYTGAGISTSAGIPDYRGTNGIWTRLQQGKDIGNHDLSLAEPTFTHMALAQLYHSKRLKYIISQNCDGLHLRSGLPRTALSELHGNMYMEVCKQCKPLRPYWRLFDVTENTARYAHKTMRRCYACNAELIDTIVHSGERGTLQWPLNWPGASKNADAADTILCLGSSLKVLKKYPSLWQMNKPAKRRPNLYIVNLQWTPKDDCAALKIHGKCDLVMKLVMKQLNLDVMRYERSKDPIFAHACLLGDLEMHTTTQPFLKQTETEQKEAYDLTTTAVCDKIKTGTNTHSPKSNTFSIDNILKKENPKVPVDNHLAEQNFQTLMMYCKLAFQNQMFNYFTSGLYPYQTSFLYPGLHSIINPIPYFNYDFECSGSENIRSILLQPASNSVVKIEPEQSVINCQFCYNLYDSFTCLYYTKMEPVFVKQLSRFSKVTNTNKLLVCLCCDYSTDEDELSDSNDDNNENKMNKKLKRDDQENSGENTDEMNEESKEKVVKIQAGWFGKGYRKNRKARKKQQY